MSLELTPFERSLLEQASHVVDVFERDTKMTPTDYKWKSGCFDCSHTQGVMSATGNYYTVGLYGVTNNQIETSPRITMVVNTRDSAWRKRQSEYPTRKTVVKALGYATSSLKTMRYWEMPMHAVHRRMYARITYERGANSPTHRNRWVDITHYFSTSEQMWVGYAGAPHVLGTYFDPVKLPVIAGSLTQTDNWFSVHTEGQHALLMSTKGDDPIAKALKPLHKVPQRKKRSSAWGSGDTHAEFNATNAIMEDLDIEMEEDF